MKHLIFIIIGIGILSSGELLGQQFKAMAIVGANAAQIDGDTLYGFDKIGLTVGGRLSYTNEKVWDVALEMLYSQRGSKDGLFRKESDREINLHYLEFPILFSLRDWYVEADKYYKVRVEGGFSYGHLFQADAVGFDVEDFKKNDISWILGAGINFNKMFGISLRYTSSMIDLNHKAPEEDKYKSYFLTLRSEITF